MILFPVLLGVIVVVAIIYGIHMIATSHSDPVYGNTSDYLAVSNNQELVKQTEILRRQLELSTMDRNNSNLGENK
jgi:hypothetical protein